MSLRPIRDQIVVKRTASEEKSKGGIIFAQVAVEKSFQGEVIAVGSGRLLADGKSAGLEVAVGDKVMFRKGMGIEVTNDAGEELVILTEDALLCVVE